MSETVESVGNFQDRYIPEDIVERYFSLSSNKKKKDYLSSTDEEYYKKITFENDTNYLYHLIEQNYLPDVLAPKDYHMLDTKYSQLSQIYMTYGALIGLLKAKAEGFLPPADWNCEFDYHKSGRQLAIIALSEKGKDLMLQVFSDF